MRKNSSLLLPGILAGVVLTFVAAVLCAYVCVTRGWLPANADSPAPRWETWAAHRSLHVTIRREAPKGPNPVALNDDNLKAGVRLYAAHCAVCHGSANGKASKIADGLYQKPPQLAADGVEDDPEGQTYWVVAHGIRLTGMPAFSSTLSEQQIWQLALFLAHMDKLPPAVQKAWTAVPSAG